MIMLLIASTIFAAAVQNAAATSARSALTDCLRSAVAQASTNKLAADAIVSHMRQACDAPAGRLKAALVAFDVKNGISRKQAAEDADLQLDDYYATQEEKYRYLLEKGAQTASSN